MPDAAKILSQPTRLSAARAIGLHIAQRAVAIAAMAPRLDAGMWYSDDLLDFARVQDARMSPLSTMPGRVPTDAFERLPRRFGLYALRLRPCRSASEALRHFIAGPTVTECGNWLMALQYEALLHVMGESAFDAHFGDPDVTLPTERRMLLNHPDFGALEQLWCDVDVPEQGQDVSLHVGDLVHFAGVPHYAVKHPLGVAVGGTWCAATCEVHSRCSWVKA